MNGRAYVLTAAGGIFSVALAAVLAGPPLITHIVQLLPRAVVACALTAVAPAILFSAAAQEARLFRNEQETATALRRRVGGSPLARDCLPT